MKKSIISSLLIVCILFVKGQTITPTPPNKGIDVGVAAILWPVLDSTISGTLDSVKINITNFGSTTETSFPVSYSINNMVYSVETWSGVLLPGQSTEYQFAVKFTVPFGNYYLCSKSILSGDALAINDQSCRNFFGSPDPGGIDSYSYSNWNLYQNTPNPATDKTLIKFELPASGKVSLEVHDLLGNIVFSDHKECNAGTDQFEIDANSIPSGFYFYSVKYNDMIRTKPMIIHN